MRAQSHLEVMIGSYQSRRMVGTLLALLIIGILTGNSRAEQSTPPPASATESSQANTGHQQENQSNSGSIETHSGGASPVSPQGDTPPGMQPVPSESNKISPQK